MQSKQIIAITVTERRRWNVCKFSLLNFIENWPFNLHKVIVFQTCCSSSIPLSNVEVWKKYLSVDVKTVTSIILLFMWLENKRKKIFRNDSWGRNRKAAFKRLFSSFNFPWWHIKNLSFLLHHEQFNKFSHSILKASPTATSHTFCL